MCVCRVAHRIGQVGPGRVRLGDATPMGLETTQRGQSVCALRRFVGCKQPAGWLHGMGDWEARAAAQQPSLAQLPGSSAAAAAAATAAAMPPASASPSASALRSITSSMRADRMG